MQWIDNMAVTKEIIVAIIGCVKSTDVSCIKFISNKAKAREAVMIGMERSIENIAAESLLTFRILAPVIVTPALLAPGIKAKT